MSVPCDEHLRDASEIARQLTILADEGEADSQDDSCMVLYAVVRDCAYRIRHQIEQEQKRATP